jgi:AsmA protein
MGKLLKIILSLAGVLVVLIVVAAVVLPFVVDPNDYKDKITTAVRDKTGRTLEIGGDISLSVFPWLGLDIGQTQFSNAAGFSDPWMASMDSVQVRVKLLPLLKKQLEIDKVRLSGMQLNLAKDKSGKTNWADLTAAAESKDKEEEQADERGEGPGLESLAIGGIDISDAQLVWDDRQAGARYEINDLSVTTGEIAAAEPFDLDIGFSIAASEPEVAGQFKFSGELLIADSLKALDVTGARLNLDASGDGVPGGKLQLALATDMALDLEAQTLALPELVVETLGMKLTGNVAGTGITGDKSAFNGVLKVAGFAPRDVFKALGMDAPETTDAGVLGKADAALTWNASTKHFAVSDLKLHLDDTSVTGNARVDSFDAPAIGFTLAVDSIDLDRYMPPAPAEGESADKSQGAAEPPQLEGLRKLNLNGKLTVAKMKATGLSYNDVVLQLKARDGVVRMHPIGAKLYSGSYNGDITLDARGKTPKVSVNEKVSGVQAGPLLKDLIGDDKLLGTANVQATFTGSGLTPDELRRTVSGNASFSFTDGAVKGVNIAALIRKAQAAYKGQPAPADDQPNQTDFAVMSGSAVVTNGLVRNDDLSLQSPLLRITGKGQTHLAEETIDYTLTTKIVGSLEGQGGKDLAELKGIAIPVHVGGTYSKPSYRPDLASVLTEAAKEKVKEKVEEKVQEKIQDKIGDKLGDQLKGLFK